MASRSIIYFTLMCALSATLVASQATDSTTIMPDELHYSSRAPSTDEQPSELIEPSGEFTSMSPTNNNLDNDDQQQQQQLDNDYRRPPFNFFGPPRRPSSLFESLLGPGMMESMRRHQEMLEKQFQQLQQQADKGEEVSYFSRNGVSFVRTCTTKRVQ